MDVINFFVEDVVFIVQIVKRYFVENADLNQEFVYIAVNIYVKNVKIVQYIILDIEGI
jgi:hypothetical protein